MTTEFRQRLLRIAEVTELTGISAPHIRRLARGEQFPKAVLLVPGGQAKAWVESEVHEWIEQRIQARNAS